MSNALDTVVRMASEAHSRYMKANADSKDYFAGKANGLAACASEIRGNEVFARTSRKDSDALLRGYIDRAFDEADGMCLDNDGERKMIVALAVAAAQKFLEDQEERF